MKRTVGNLIAEYRRAEMRADAAAEEHSEAEAALYAAEDALAEAVRKAGAPLVGHDTIVDFIRGKLRVRPMRWAHEILLDELPPIPSEAATGSEFPDEAEVRANDLAHLAGHPLAQTARQCCPEEVP